VNSNSLSCFTHISSDFIQFFAAVPFLDDVTYCE
jgi:hypothetical protein